MRSRSPDPPEFLSLPNLDWCACHGTIFIKGSVCMAAFDLPINDIYLSASHKNSLEMPSPSGISSTLVPPSPPQPFDPDGLIDFLGTVPPIVTKLLVELSPTLSLLRRTAQILSWRSGKQSESWLCLAMYWAICLGAGFSIRYFLPLIVLTPFMISAAVRRPVKSSAQVEPATEAVLSQALADVKILHHLLPNPTVPPLTLWWMSLIRLSSALYLVYLVIIISLPLSVSCGIAGSLVITWRAPWAATIRRIILSNGWVTYTARHIWHRITGTLLPEELSGGSTIGKTSTVATEETPLPPDVPPASSLRFKFTVHENQRWWMGIDWTAALLPNERVSWTSGPPTLRPLPPPINITLPPSKAVYLPVPNVPAVRVKRTATWTWEETDWGVVVRLNPTTPPERVGMALPKVTMNLPDGTPVSGISSAESLLQRGLQKVGTVSAELTSPTRTGRVSELGDGSTEVSSNSEGGAGDGDVGENETIIEGPGAMVYRATPEEDITDAEGWIYSDNKWEGPSGKGGIGKFTRYRRWTRIAVLNETVQVIAASEDPSARASRPRSSSGNNLAKGPSPGINLRTPEPTTGSITKEEPSSLSIRTSPKHEALSISPTREKGGIRQRLQQAVSNKS
ncbi:uncharacterized protein EI90DRAFT_3287746 [Cantharellus anzutake]|uniref:uncharacterized protein n=1 Tax=Cantharellus anzutake TaxID=1750568 RepID=UPI001904581C|nr:uncharacterized protein EI90DRAFT_3287746 [Cantharellus anzutake]KAF8335838.1 hypothetical protein EI90DRAFT_3287746 [Cantharellus anzutake]